MSPHILFFAQHRTGAVLSIALAMALAACQPQLATAPAVIAPAIDATGAPAAGAAGDAALDTGDAKTPVGGPLTESVAPTQLPTRDAPIERTVTVDGVIMLGAPLVSATFVVAGRVTAVNVAPGQSVKMGDGLAQIDASALNEALALAEERLALKRAEIAKSQAPASQTDLQSARSNLSAAYAAYNAAKTGPSAADVELALRSWNQAKNSLYSSQLSRDTVCQFTPGKTDPAWEVIAKKDPDCKSAELQTQVAELQLVTSHHVYLDAQKPPSQADLSRVWSSVVQAQAALATLEKGVSAEQRALNDLQLEQAQLAVDRAARDVKKSRLFAPCDCVVQDVPFAVGALASGGISLLDGGSIRLHTSNLSERDVIKLKAGQKASLRLKAFESAFSGTIEAILPVSSGTASGAALYTAIIVVDNTGAVLLPGMTGQVEISLE